MNYEKLTAGTTKTAIDTAKPSEKGEIITYLSRMGDVLDDIAEGSKLIVALGAVHPIVYGNKVNIMLREHDLGIHTHLQIITAKTGHIFDDDPFDDPCLHIGNHFLETRPIEGCSRNAVINVKAEVGVPVFKSVLL